LSGRWLSKKWGSLVFAAELLMFFLSLMEDSGYMARAAFVMDRFLAVKNALYVQNNMAGM